MVEDLIKRLNRYVESLAPPMSKRYIGEAIDLIEQQAARLTALESERDALLAAAGKEAVAKLQVMYGPMPESNGKTNWTAILHKGDLAEGHTIDRSEYPDRVRYAADCVRYLIGELQDRPWILDYDADKHSGYVAPTAALEKGDGRDAEPVAWFHNTARKGDKPVYEQVAEEFSCYPATPLYSGPVEPIYCQACGDGITAHDPGICGNCFAMKHSGSALAMLKRIPTTPEQMIDFIGSHFNSMEAQEWSEFSGDAVAKPAGDLSMVRYSLTVHDLLSAFDWADLSADAIDAALSQKAGEQQ